MPLFEARRDDLVRLAATTFEAEGWKERQDIQRLLRERIEVLEEELLVIAEEFSGWNDSGRRIDLLCLDPKANLVVVELKRGEDGGRMELQALRYAAMVSAMTFDQAVETLARYRSKVAPEADAARKDILTHVGWTVSDESKFADNVRIILVSADFSRELTTSVLWLRQYGLDIRCVRLRPHRLGDGKRLLDVQQLIPLPEATDFQIRIEEKKAAERKERGERAILVGRFLDQLAERASIETDLHRERTPDVATASLSGAIGKTGFSINYVIGRDRSRTELFIQREDCRAQLARMKEEQETIEREFGDGLQWREKEGVRQCRVFCPIEGGYAAPEPEWPRIHDELINSMIKFDRIFRHRVQLLP